MTTREKELKHVIALLLEDAKRLQELEPNAGTENRILQACNALNTSVPVKRIADAITEIRALQLYNPVIEDPLKKLIAAVDDLLDEQ